MRYTSATVSKTSSVPQTEHIHGNEISQRGVRDDGSLVTVNLRWSLNHHAHHMHLRPNNFLAGRSSLLISDTLT